jgi:hypothetical protein
MQIKIVELIAAAIENGKIKIVPDVLVTGGREYWGWVDEAVD